jgi:hypothetical protein
MRCGSAAAWAAWKTSVDDLRKDLGVNDEAVPIVLDLVDQSYSLRGLLRELMERNRHTGP